MVAFDTEVSLIAARNRSGQLAFYPLTENFHRDGILRMSRAPSHPELQSLAEQHLTHLLERLDYIGVLAVEFFVRGSHLLANEMAPRVHNSGHWTIEGSDTSQFENHLRAILGLPLGSTDIAPHGDVQLHRVYAPAHRNCAVLLASRATTTANPRAPAARSATSPSPPPTPPSSPTSPSF